MATLTTLPQNSVDWLYTWSLLYYMNMHRDVLIVLKNTLKWVPILGWVRVLRMPCICVLD